jgi:hypothetical protein
MNEKEFNELVTATSQSLGISHLVNDKTYLDELYNESDGHPYVIKVLLGDVAKEGKISRVKRIVASKDEILTALFERTYNGLTPVAKRIFLTLSNWRSTIPEVAIEAILIREANELMDVAKGIEELYRSSLVLIEISEKDGMRFLSVPYSASVFGKKKLSVSAMKTAIQADTKLLHTFGVGLHTEIHLGIEPRIIKFFRDIAKRVSLKLDKNKKYATAQTGTTKTVKLSIDNGLQGRTTRTTGYNSTYPKGGVSCSKDSFVVNQTLVFQIKFCSKGPALRVAAKR